MRGIQGVPLGVHILRAPISKSAGSGWRVLTKILSSIIQAFLGQVLRVILPSSHNTFDFHTLIPLYNPFFPRLTHLLDPFFPLDWVLFKSMVFSSLTLVDDSGHSLFNPFCLWLFVQTIVNHQPFGYSQCFLLIRLVTSRVLSILNSLLPCQITSSDLSSTTHWTAKFLKLASIWNWLHLISLLSQLDSSRSKKGTALWMYVCYPKDSTRCCSHLQITRLQYNARAQLFTV